MHLSTENSAGYLQRVQIFLKPLHMTSDSVYWVRDMAKFFTYKKHPVHWNSSAMVMYIDFIVTDIKQTCLRQGLGVTITARKRTIKLMFTSDP